jgi:hypothetical protein
VMLSVSLSSPLKNDFSSSLMRRQNKLVFEHGKTFRVSLIGSSILVSKAGAYPS